MLRYLYVLALTLALGSTAPAAPIELSVQTLDGKTFNLAEHRGQWVVVNFWATWCGPCRAIIPDLVKLQEKHKSDGLQVVGVTRFYGYGSDFDEKSALPNGGKSVGSPTDPAKKLSETDEVTVNEHFVKAFQLNYPVVFSEEKLGKDVYGVQGIPTVFVIGRDGKVIGHAVGSGKENHEKVVKWIEDALGTGATDASGKKGDGAHK